MYPSFYRKKPVLISAMQWDGTEHNADEIIEWIGFNGGYAIYLPPGYDAKDNLVANTAIEIDTLEGKVLASKFDYILKGVESEFYPCKPSIFVATYKSDLDYERDYLFEAQCMIDQEKRTNPRYQPGAALFAQIGLAQQVKRIADMMEKNTKQDVVVNVVNDKTKPLHFEKA